MKIVMKKLLIVFLVFGAASAYAQIPGANVIKTNIPGWFLGNYNLQYERKLNGHWSLAASGRYMPVSGLPFKTQLRKYIKTDDARADQFLDDARLGNLALTPEVIYYFNGKGSGFYSSLFYRYTRVRTSELQVVIQESKYQDTVSLQGDIHAHSLGLQLGWQKNLGERFLVDLWLLGPQYGFSEGMISGRTKRSLNGDEQQLLRQNLEEYSIKYFREDINVDANGADIRLKGPWAGLRVGVSVGIRF